MTDISVRTADLAGVVVATPVGRLDLSTYAELRDGLLEQATGVPVALVVRLGPDFESASHAMLSVFATVWTKISHWPDVPLVLLAETARHHRDLRRSGVTRHVATTTDLAAALERAEEPPLRRCRCLSLPRSLVAPLMARDAVRSACEEWTLPGVVDDALLVVSELVENAVRYAGSEPLLRVELHAGGLSLAVRDDNPEPPAHHAGPWQGGLDLVDRMCVARGSTPSSGGGKVVWAVLPLRRQR